MSAWYDNPPLPGINVSDHKPVETGVLDKHGNPITRPPNQMGFHQPRGKPR